MRGLCLFPIACVLCNEAAAATLPPPIAQASNGQLQCYSPDTTAKTCQSLAAYKPGVNGTIDNTAMVLVSKTPPVVMTVVTPVEIKAEQVCGPIRQQDVDAATFTVDGQPATPAQTTTFRTVMQAAMATAFGQLVCTAYLPGGATLIARATINGTPQPGQDQNVIWVAPTDGYKVGP